MSYRPRTAARSAGSKHPRCPYRRYFPTNAAARVAAVELGGCHPQGCAICGGFHLAINRGSGDPS